MPLNGLTVAILDARLNDTMEIISEYIKTIPLYWLFVLSHIEPSALQRQVKEYLKIQQLSPTGAL